MARRAYGLSQRHRRLLILIDGSRDLNDLASLVPDPALSELYADLLEQEFIMPVAESGLAQASPATASERSAANGQGYSMAYNFANGTAFM